MNELNLYAIGFLSRMREYGFEACYSTVKGDKS